MSEQRTHTVTIYLKSGNVMVINDVEMYNLELTVSGEIRQLNILVSGTNLVKYLDLTEIEAVVVK